MENIHKARAVASAGLLLIVAIAALSGAFEGSRSVPPQAKAAELTANGVELLTEGFSILREGEPASTDWQERIPEDFVENYELVAEHARSTAAGPDSDIEVTVIPGQEGICLVSPSVTSCAPTGDALRFGVVALEFCAPDLPDRDTRLTALLPDGVMGGSATLTVLSAGMDPEQASASLGVLVHVQTGDPSAFLASALNTTIPLPQGDEEVACG